MRKVIFSLIVTFALSIPSFADIKGETIRASVVPPDTTLSQGEQIKVGIDIDLSNTSELLGAYSASLEWNTSVLEFVSVSGGTTSGFDNPSTNQNDISSGRLLFNQFNAAGSDGVVNVINVIFKVIGNPGSTTVLDLEFSALDAANTFNNLLPILVINDGSVKARSDVQGSAEADVVPSDSNPEKNDQIEVAINIDLSNSSELLGAYSASLEWNTSVLEFVSVSGGTTSGFDNPNTNQNDISSGRLLFNQFNTTGASGLINVINVTFRVTGNPGTATILYLEFTALDAAKTFTSLLSILTITNGMVTVGGSDQLVPDIDVSAVSHDFGDVQVGNSSDWTIVVSNTGNADLAVSSISLKNNQFSVSPLSFTVSAGKSQNVAISFSPTTGGARTDTLIIACNDPDEKIVQISVTGNGIQPLVEKKLEVTSPNGGETFLAGTTHTITWTSSNVTNIKIEYSADNGKKWITLTDSVSASDGSNLWTVQDLYSTECKVRISDIEDASVTDLSDGSFTILPVPSVTAISPNGGEMFEYGSTQTIQWNATVNIETIRLEYSTDNGSSWITLESELSAADGSYSWEIPDVESGNCLIKVTDTKDANIFDESDEPFTITQQPFISLVSPDGGEELNVGSQQTIIWSSVKINNVKIEYSLDNGSNWLTIKASIPASDSSYSWIVPDFESTECFIRISDVDDSNLFDVSDANFTILKSAFIQVTSPNGTENWEYGVTSNITWSSYRVTNVRIEYSTDGGKYWTIITDSTDASTGSYSWSIPSVVSLDCYVRITDASDANFTDISDATFSINPPPSIELTSPDGGEEFIIGTPITIAWTSESVANVKIEFSVDDGANWSSVNDSTDASAVSYVWTIPDNVSSQCLVKITDITNQSVNDQSDGVFTISLPPSITVTSPYGSEEWEAGSQQNISWDSQGVAQVRIEYSTDGGGSWNLIVDRTDSAPGLYQWDIPDVESSSCLVRIIDTSDDTITDDSDGIFTISRMPFIQVTAPMEGDLWMEESAQTIEWKSSSVSEVNIEYSTDGGGSWTTIQTNVNAFDPIFYWTVPEDESDTCIIRISDVSNPEIRGESGIFKITTSDYITITSPAADDKWSVITEKEIKWEFKGVENVSIEVSYDDGNTWAEMLTASIDAYTGSYSWMVPDTPNDRCRIRVADASRPDKVFFITEPFEIIRPEVKIAHMPQTEAQENEEIIFTVTVTATAEVESVIFYYNKMGESESIVTYPMKLIVDNTYSYTLPVGVFITPGIEYHIVATDVNGIEARSPVDVGFHSINAWVSDVNSTNEVYGGSEQTAYRMISIPLYLNATSIIDQLRDTLPPGKMETDWRLFRYPAGSTTPQEYPDIEPFLPGLAFWLISVDNFVLKTPEGKTVPTDERFRIDLKSGWNDIANPWMFDISWDNMGNPGNAKLSALYTYEGQWSDPTNPPKILEPWKGYAIKNLESSTKLIFLRTESMVEKPAVAQDTEVWKLTIRASAGEAKDTANHLGVRSDAKVEWDRYDHVEPPQIGEYVSVSFPHRDWTQYPYDYTVDFRPPDDTVSWDFDVKTNIFNETVSIELEGIEQLPDEYFIKIFDRDKEHEVDIINNTFGFVSGKDLTERYFTLVVSNSFEKQPEQDDSKPKQFITAVSYPNPFNPHTTIRYELSHPGKVKISVFNSLGQRVLVYEIGHREQGIHELVFDASELTSGLYFYLVDAGYLSVTRKMLYMK